MHQKLKIAIIIILLALFAVSNLGMPLVVKNLVDAAIIPEVEETVQNLLLLGGLTAMVLLTEFGNRAMIEAFYLDERIHLRNRMMQGYLRMHLPAFKQESEGDRLSALINDVPIFVRKGHRPFNYNVLYFLRSRVLFNAIITFYITQLILLGGEDLGNRLFSIGFVIAVQSLYILYTLWNLEKDRVLSFYDQQHRQTVYNEKIKAFYIILILYMLCILPYLTITLGLRRAAVLFMLQLIPAVTIAGVLFYKNRKNDFRLEKKNYILFLLLFLVSIIVSISMM